MNLLVSQQSNIASIEQHKIQHQTPARILYVHYGENWLRGSEIVLLDMLKQALENNYSPLLWCNSELLAKRATELGVEVIVDELVCLGYWTTPRWNIKRFWQQLRKAKKLIKHYGISLVHCNNGAPCQWMTPICKYTGTPLLLHLHARYQYRDRLTLLFHGADRVIGVSKSIIEHFQYREFDAQKQGVIYNGIDPQRAISTSAIDIRAELNAKETDFVILYMGSLIPRKCVDQLIHAVDALKQTFNIKLAIVGSGSEQQTLAQLTAHLQLEKKVKFFASTDEVASVYSSNADCFISVPTEEVFGLTLAEASIAKLPIITSNIPGINEIYSHNENALLVTPKNTDELVAAIQSLIENPFLKTKLAMNARSHVLESFSLTKQFQHFDSSYQMLLKQEKKISLVQNIFHHSKRIIYAIVNKCFKKFIHRFTWSNSHE